MNKDFTYGRNFADFLGSFWSTIFDKGALGSAIGYSSSENLVQLYMDMVDVINSSSIYSVPVFSRKNVYPVSIRKSFFIEYSEIPEYASGGFWGAQPEGQKYRPGTSLEYGKPALLSSLYFHPLESITGVSLGLFAINRLFEPSVTLCKDSDFTQNADGIVFRDNPFDNPLFPSRKIWDESTQTLDEEIVIWFCDIDKDEFTAYKQFGYTFTNFKLSSEQYKRTIQTVFEMVSLGPSLFRIDAFLSAISGSPLIRETLETVESIVDTPEGRIVVTDLNVYQASKDINLRKNVNVGAQLMGGTPILDIVEVIDTKQDKWWSNMDAIPLRAGAFSGNNRFLSFQNQSFQVKYLPKLLSIDPVYRGVSFPLIGSSEAINNFWKGAVNRSTEFEKPYGLLLMQKYGLKGYTDIDFINGAPFFVNPAQVLAEDMSYGTLLPIKLKISTVTDLELFFKTIDILTPSCPTHINLMLFFELTDNLDIHSVVSGQVEVSPTPLLEIVSGSFQVDEATPDDYTSVEAVSIGEGFYGGSYNFSQASLDSRGCLSEKIDLSRDDVLVQNVELKQIPKCIV